MVRYGAVAQTALFFLKKERGGYNKEIFIVKVAYIDYIFLE